MNKLVVMLRVKDGNFFVEEWLTCYEKIADEFIVLDNGSTDGTYERLKSHNKVVDIMQTQGYDEGRDKNMMYAMARKRKPDWCLWVDVDEIFEPQLTRKHFERLMNNPFIKKYRFRRFHFIDREYFAGSRERLRYSAGHDRMLWKESPTGYFENLIIDSPNVKGIKGLRWNTHFRLKHLGYINKELVDKKAEIYRAIIPEKEETLQEMYLRNEKPVKWVDDRSSLEVIKLNWKLDFIRFNTVIPRAIKKIKAIIKSRKKAPRFSTAAAS